MLWKPIPEARFKSFHDDFIGDSEKIFHICRDCGGKCEYSKISTLLPGEAAFMARHAGLPVDVFRARYLDGLRIGDQVLEVLKLIDPCPFLGSDFSCQCRSFKPVLCKIYPIVFEIGDGRIGMELDPWCPLAQQEQNRRYFDEVGITAVQALGIPASWVELVIPYDELYFDYPALEALRRKNGVASNDFWVIDAATLLQHQQDAESVRRVLDS